MAMNKQKSHFLAAGDGTGSVSMFSFILEKTLQKLGQCLNCTKLFKILVKKRIEQFDMYQYLSVMLFRNSNGIRQEKALDALSGANYIIYKADRMGFISTNILAYSTADRGDVGDEARCVRRDITLQLETSKNLAYSTTGLMLSVSPHFFSIIDND